MTISMQSSLFEDTHILSLNDTGMAESIEVYQDSPESPLLTITSGYLDIPGITPAAARALAILLTQAAHKAEISCKTA